MSEIHDECGIAAVALLDGKDESLIPLLYSMLLKMQNRGHLAAGFATFAPHQKKCLKRYRENGSVNHVFSPFATLKDQYKGTKGIGHTRYAVSGSTDVECAQPFLHRDGHIQRRFAIAFNGNIANYRERKEALAQKNIALETTVDTELLLYEINEELAQHADNLPSVFANLAARLDGAYNLAFINANDELAVVRDPLGIRPICYGFKDGLVAAASESVALENIGIENITDLPPGTMLLVKKNDVSIVPYTTKTGRAHCMFEWIYFSNVCSMIEGRSVYEARRALGHLLGKRERERLAGVSEVELAHDYIVIPVPNSALPISKGFAEELGIREEEGLIKVESSERTFIDSAENKLEKVANKFDVNRAVLEGKKVYVIEDSIVRGNTAKSLVELLRTRGKVREVHYRVACPPIKSPCFYGIDMSTFQELLAMQTEGDITKMEKLLGVDSLVYQSVDDLITGLGLRREQLCLGCLTGKYPTPKGDELVKEALGNYQAGIKKRTYE
ncbi:amidophosphoribosyltransferase [Candidatus Woesearchaeota archaeon]|nr:amidophosphoribosyltransferase [Candidatus Woesearchaeota archaeon]